MHKDHLRLVFGLSAYLPKLGSASIGISAISSIKDKKPLSHSRSGKLTSRQEPRRNTDSKAIKRPSDRRNSSRSLERNAKEPRLTPSHNEENTQTDKSKSVATKDVSKGDAASKPERYNELSPLMTKMVEDELKNVMINVWQSLPSTSASNATEKMVLEKLYGAAGDDLRNTIGLNVTNRLLNIHNGILVKIIIFSAVTPSELYSFSKKFNVQELKNVRARTYAGRLATWADLDTLVTKKDLRCGKSRVSITPIYNFLKCPPSLRTVFDGSQDYSAAKAQEQEVARTMKKVETKPVLTADIVLAENAKRTNAKNDSSKAEAKDTTGSKSYEKPLETKNSNDKTSGSKASTQESVTDSKNSKVISSNKKVENKSDPSKAESVTKSKNIEKPAEKKPANKQHEPTVAKNETTTKSTNIQAKMEPPKIVEKKTPDVVKKEAKTETQPTKVEPSKTIADKQVETNISKDNTPKTVNTKVSPKVVTAIKKDVEPPKSNENKTQVKTAVVPNTTPNKEPTNTAKPITPNLVKKETVQKPMEVKKAAKVVPKTPVKVITKPNYTPKRDKSAEMIKSNTKLMKTLPKSAKRAGSYRADTKSKRNESDFDELSDHDILAMLSGGIVLDECSGSEDE